MDPRIADYIRANRTQYTREAIRARLIEAGHSPEEVDWTWDRLGEAEPMAPPGPSGFRWYVWMLFGLCAVLIAIPTVITAASGQGFGFAPFGVGWLVAFIVVAVWPALWFARQRPSSALGWIGMILVVPVVFLLIGGGICYATIFVIASGLG
jgi:hypothetical protein